VTIDEVRQWMDEGRTLVFLDSRSDGSWRAGTTKVPGAIRVPPHDIESHLESIPRDHTIVVYCT
jgi:rhodanese-related sulfurtransferase